jgi:hypothetical protein
MPNDPPGRAELNLFRSVLYSTAIRWLGASIPDGADPRSTLAARCRAILYAAREVGISDDDAVLILEGAVSASLDGGASDPGAR